MFMSSVKVKLVLLFPLEVEVTIGVCGLRGWLLKKHSHRVCNLEKLKYLSPMIRRS